MFVMSHLLLPTASRRNSICLVVCEIGGEDDDESVASLVSVSFILAVIYVQNFKKCGTNKIRTSGVHVSLVTTPDFTLASLIIIFPIGSNITS